MTLTDKQLGYLAGIVDGEGCLTVTRERTKYYASGFKYSPVFKIVNTDLELLKYIQRLIGSGSIIQLKQRLQNRKQIYQLELYPNAQRQILPLIAPLLRCKKQQAECLIKLLTLTAGHHANHRYRKVDHSEKIEELYERIRPLNRRGIIGVVLPKVVEIAIRKPKG